MARSKWKAVFQEIEIFQNNIPAESTSSTRPITIQSRRSSIPLSMGGAFVKIHNGLLFVTRRITKTMVGHKFGEFSLTRKPLVYKKKAKKGKIKKK
jgi:small subunit ribosomal protein S19